MAFLLSCSVVRVFWLALKYYLAACGAVMLLTLFFERSLWLGIAQLLAIGLGVRAELEDRASTGCW